MDELFQTSTGGLDFVSDRKYGEGETVGVTVRGERYLGEQVIGGENREGRNP